VSDQLRDLVTPVGEFDPPLDLHSRILAREAELVAGRREPWRPPRVLMVGLAAVGVGLVLLALAIAAHSRSAVPAPANGPSQQQQHSLSGDCSNRDMEATFELRRPSHRQDAGVFKAHSHRRVVTIVVRNVGVAGCYGRPAFRMKILDRQGRTVGAWDDQGGWFAAYYMPGGIRTFSLPDVYRCDRPGPFTAIARVHGQLIRRRHLSRSQITC
jgi:hypothetical protein